MGFTRYWDRTDKEINKEFMNDCKKVIGIAESDYKIKLTRYGQEDENDFPIITEEKIMINGDAKHSCESLVIDNSDGSDFCKTNGHPYDIVVNVVLKIAEKHGLVKNIESDGNNEEDKADKLLKKALKITE